MPLIEIDNAGAIGLVKDVKRSVMPIEAWDDLVNIRCRENVLQSIGNDISVYNVNGLAVTFLMEIRGKASQYWYLATNGKIYQTAGIAVPTDRTKLATTYGGVDSSVWSGVDFHQQRIMNVNSGSDLPQHINDAASNFVDLPNWPAATYCKWFSAYKNFLLAFNITEGANEFPSRIKWSDLADTGQLPGSWDETDPSTLSGENDIMSKGGGQVLSSLELNDIMYVYKSNAIWYLYPSGNIYVFNFKEMEESQGILGSYAVTDYMKNHYLATQGDVVLNNGQRLTSIIDKTNRNYLFDNLHASYSERVQLVTNYKMGEIWVCFPNQSSTGWLNEALIWNVSEKTWGRRELNDFSFLDSGIVDTSVVSQIIDDDSGIIDQDFSIIDAIDYNPSIESILTVRPGLELGLNLLSKPEKLDDSIWVQTGTGTVTPNAIIAPDGTLTGDLLDDTDAAVDAAYWVQTISIPDDSLTRNLSIFVKEGSALQTALFFFNFGGTLVSAVPVITWATKTISEGTLTLDKYGWYRAEVSLTNNSTGNTSAQCRIYPASNAISILGSVYAWGAQLTEGAFVLNYDPVPKLFQLDGVTGILPNGKFVRQGLTMIGRDRFGQWKYSATARKLVTRLYPKFTGAGTFNIYIGSSVTVDGAVTWSPPESYTIGGLGHVDFFHEGEAIALRIEPQSTTKWEYSGCEIQLHVPSENTV